MRRTEFTVKLPYEVEEVQHVIPIRCSDARDIGAVENGIMHELTIEYASRGVQVMVDRQTIAGSVVNRQTFIEIKELIKAGLARSLAEFGELLTVTPMDGLNVLHTTTVQISGHADIKLLTPDLKLIYTPNDIEISDHHSSVNCGMSHATEVWRTLRDFLYALKPEIKFFDKSAKKWTTEALANDETMFRLLRSCYAHDGDSVDDFITSIHLTEQPRISKEFLRRMLDADNELARMPVNINWGLINYRTGLKLRFDNNDHVHTILDDVALVMRYAMEHLPMNHPEKLARTSAQKPVCGLVCTPDIPNPREMVIKYIKTTEGRDDLDVAGSVFLVTGMNVRNPFSSFGPYKLGGLCYSIMNLGIRDYYIVGKDEAEVLNIERKIMNDPILSIIIKSSGVQLRHLTLGELHAKGVHSHSTSVDEQVRDLIREGIQKSIKHPKSPLLRQVKSPHIRTLLHGV